MSANPILSAVFCLLFLGLGFYMTPKLFRRIRAFFWLVANKVFAFVARPDTEQLLYAGLSSAEDQKLGSLLGGRKADPQWSAKILIGQCKRFPGFTAMTLGRLVAESSSPDRLHFVGHRWMRLYHAELALDGLEITQEPRLFSEDIVLYDLAGTKKLILRLPSGHRAMANRIVERLIMRRDAAMPMPSDRVMLAEAALENGASVEPTKKTGGFPPVLS